MCRNRCLSNGLVAPEQTCGFKAQLSVFKTTEQESVQAQNDAVTACTGNQVRLRFDLHFGSTALLPTSEKAGITLKIKKDE